MPRLLQLLFALLPLLVYGQVDYNFKFPDYIELDPTDYRLRVLKVIKVEQCSMFKLKSDSIFENSNLDYVLEYDSIHRLKSWKYDFANEIYPIYTEQGFGDQKVEYRNHGNTKLVTFFNGTESVHYNYNECKFEWEGAKIKSVSYEYAQLNSPYGYISGLNYTHLNKFHKTVKTIFEGDRIQEKIILLVGGGKVTYKYRYKSFKVENSDTLYLLLDTITVTSFDNKETIISEEIKQITYYY